METTPATPGATPATPDTAAAQPNATEPAAAAASDTQWLHAQIDHRFVYHAPTGDQPGRYQQLREKARELGHLIVDLCPESREQSIALTKLEESIFFANASIARGE